MRIRTLSESESKAVLAAHRVARLACANNWRPYIVPIHYVYADDAIYGFSLPGKKIEWMRFNPLVCLLVDDKEPRARMEERSRRWPLRGAPGTHRAQGRAGARLVAARKYTNWWEPGALKPETTAPSDHPSAVFFRVLIAEISGRQATE